MSSISAMMRRLQFHEIDELGYAGAKAIEAAARLQHEGVNMEIGGVPPDAVSAAIGDGLRLGNQYGFDADRVAKMLNEVRGPLNTGTSPDEGMKTARALMDPLLRFAVTAQRTPSPGRRKAPPRSTSFTLESRPVSFGTSSTRTNTPTFSRPKARYTPAPAGALARTTCRQR